MVPSSRIRAQLKSNIAVIQPYCCSNEDSLVKKSQEGLQKIWVAWDSNPGPIG